MSPETPQILAAVDLGSNSFHLIVARLREGRLAVLDRLREMVRLAGGLDAEGRLAPEATERALACLRRFGQRLRDLGSESVRAVGTNTLRRAHNRDDFLAAAEEALGHPIEIIAGVEEARLIYLGVAHSLAEDGERRLVVDIGGGSTELIIGERFEPIHMDSLYMGCVGMSREFFPGGAITRKNLRRAVLAARVELEPVMAIYGRAGWEQAVGASGTVRAIARVARGAGWSDQGITLEALKKLGDALVKAGHADNLSLGGLSAERAPVFPGGVAVLMAAFEALGIERMLASEGALREGLLYDLLGRARLEDVRGRTVTSLAQLYSVDTAHAERVRLTARRCLARVEEAWGLGEDPHHQLLGWAAELHGIGLAISHSGYHKHGAYILANADLAGFSRQEQGVLAALVRAHRRKFPLAVFTELPAAWGEPARRLAVLLRLGVLLHRSRSPAPLPAFRLRSAGKEARALHLELPEGWLEAHPLTRADLEREAAYLAAAGFDLTFS